MASQSDFSSLSGLTEQEAKDFHQAYVQGFIAFTAIAVVAHLLLYIWKPWF